MIELEEFVYDYSVENLDEKNKFILITKFNDVVKIYSENREEITSQFSSFLEDIKKLDEKDFVLEAFV